MTDIKKNNKESFSHKLGDKIERAGEKISNSGAKKIGDAISKTGNKIEHMNDDKTGRKDWK